ncbi:MAG TPA: hypothetical protein VF755_07720 [Catenuloplanes sp.]|jgi:hypothetical protein
MNDQVDVAVDEDEDESAVLEPTITPRRLLRWTAIVGTAIIVMLACWDDPGLAHGGVRLTVHNDGRGAVWVDTTWQDGHPVGEPVSATLSARERGGATVRPVALRGLATGTARYDGTLANGTWTVTVDVAKPGAGTCTAVVTVAAAGAPESVTCDDSAPAGSGGGVATAPATDRGTSGTVLITAAAVVGLLFAGTAVVLLRRRRG